MNSYTFSITLTVLANVGYHLCQKSISQGGEPADLTDRHLRSGSADSIDRCPLLRHLFGLGFGILLLELGFLLAYRAGWNLSTAALASNVTVALVLLPIGLLAFREQLNAWNWMGVVLALAAIVLIGKK